MRELPPGGRWFQGKGARLRLVWGVLAATYGVILCLPGLGGTIARAAWVAVNVLLFFFLAGWALFHPRAVAPGFGVARSWAFWVALLITLLGSSYIEQFLGEGLGFKIPGGLMLLAALVFFVFFAPLLLIDGLIGAAAGVYFGPGADRAARARMGAGAWWLVSLPLLLLGGPISEQPAWEHLTALFFVSGPVLTVLLCRELARRDLEPRRMAHLLLELLSRRLIWRRVRAGRRDSVDFRGPALGLLAAVLVVLISASEALVPLQSVALVSLIRLRNEPFMGRGSFYLATHPQAEAERERIVLLTMDSETVRQALTNRSEAAVQAEILRALRPWKPDLIVLPASFGEDEAGLRPVHAPAPDRAVAERAARDLPALERLVATMPNVVIGVPTRAEAYMRESWRGAVEVEASGNPHAARVAQAARYFGQSGLAFVGAARLPAIPTRWQGPAPLPLVVAAAARGHSSAVARVPGERAVRFGSRVIPEIARDRLLVDFLGAGPGQEFHTETYGAVLRGSPVFSGHRASRPFFTDGEPGTWVTPREFFAGKIVFLDDLAQPIRDTPVGPMPQMEVLAHATATLMSDAQVRGAGLAGFVLWPVLLGTWVGSLCQRRRPLDGVWRAAGVLFLIVVVTAGAFLVWGTWIDAVAPILVVLGAFALATQFTFELERGERDRNRALLQRFVAPQLVDQMLDDPDFELGLGGKRRQVCVVFADVRNFTGFAERHAPEHVIEVTNRYLSAMTDAVHHYGGILDKYTGDGLMAFFQDAPGAAREGDSPLMARAVQACLAMQHAAACVSAQLHHEGLEPLRVGIGMHYGEAVVGFVGNPNRLDYTALGHTVVVSQRLQSIAEGGEVVISETVFRAVSGMFAVEPGEPVQVKGLSEPMTPYRVAALAGPVQG